MPTYTFTFKKDNIFAEFTTTDKAVVEKQFQIWVANADAYVRNRSKKSAQIANTSQPQIQEKEAEISVPTAEEKQTQEIAPVEPQSEVFDSASTLLKTINTIQGVNAEANDKVSEGVSVEEKLAEATNFEEVLEKTIENPTFEPEKTQDPVFLNLIKSKNTNDKFHYLIITAYYLSEFEKMERFSLKQINAKLMQNLSEVIDHIKLQEAINQNLIELVPDLTGTSEIGEYRLTPVGEDFFANKI